MKKLFIILVVLNNFLFANDLLKDMYEPPKLNEIDFNGSWEFFSLNKKTEYNIFYNVKNKNPIEIHFNRSASITITNEDIIKRYLVFNNKLSIGTKNAETSIPGLSEQELYKVIKVYKTKDKFCFILVGIESIFTTEEFSGIMCKKNNLKFNLTEREYKK